MWSCGIIGIVLCLSGVVWISQGTNVLSNSKLMSGHGQYTLLWIVVLLSGLALAVWAVRISKRAVEPDIDGQSVGTGCSAMRPVPAAARSSSTHPEA